MSARPGISVVIPAFRAERHLGESLDSVLAQDLEPVEIVVVDDGSDDATAAVAEGYGPPVRVVRLPENRGEAAARNRGVAESSEPVIAMHDADDRMLSHRLRVQLDRLLSAGDRIGCVLGRQTVFSDDGAPLPSWVLDEAGDPVDKNCSPVMAWRRTFEEVGPYDESFTRGCDTDWLVRVREAGLEVEFVEEILIERRVHAGNLSQTDGSPSRIEFVRSLRKALDARRSEP